MFLKCKMCGGALDLNDFKNNHVIECPYCGSAQTIPDVNDEKLEELHNKANSLRLASEFDEAMIIYHELLSKNNKDSEAHFGLVLCKYGIEYVTDPKTNKKIPTCHRLQTKSIFDDVNYQAAINNADFLSKMYYEAEGRRIDEIMKDTLLVSQKEEPYDVFISYKETNSNNERTEDSAIAETIYHNLVNKGYKVFYSKITLASKLGNEYEPIIYSALMSSKVMLLIGTSVENINSVWVKNEWSRYLGFMETDRKKHLMPCYKYFDPYLLPKELRNFQGQDLNAFGYDLDIIRGVEKVLGVKKVIKENSKVDNLINRIKILISDNEEKKALNLLEDILNIDAYSSEAYLYLALLNHHLKKPLELVSLGKKLFDDKDFKHAKEFKNSKTEDIINEIEEKINEELRQIELEKALEETRRLEALRLEKEKQEQELKLQALKKTKEAEEAALKLKEAEEKKRQEELEIAKKAQEAALKKKKYQEERPAFVKEHNEALKKAIKSFEFDFHHYLLKPDASDKRNYAAIKTFIKSFVNNEERKAIEALDFFQIRFPGLATAFATRDGLYEKYYKARKEIYESNAIYQRHFGNYNEYNRTFDLLKEHADLGPKIFKHVYLSSDKYRYELSDAELTFHKKFTNDHIQAEKEFEKEHSDALDIYNDVLKFMKKKQYALALEKIEKLRLKSTFLERLSSSKAGYYKDAQLLKLMCENPNYESTYKNALKELSKGNYFEALKLFYEILWYQDSFLYYKVILYLDVSSLKIFVDSLIHCHFYDKAKKVATSCGLLDMEMVTQINELKKVNQDHSGDLNGFLFEEATI